MKPATITCILAAAGVSLAQPAKREGPVVLPVTFNTLFVSLSNETSKGSFAVSFDDPNYNLIDNRITFHWALPGDPPADTWTNENHYLSSFPNGVNDITRLNVQIKNNNAPETINIVTNNEAADSKWTCSHVGETQTCQNSGSVQITPVIN